MRISAARRTAGFTVALAALAIGPAGAAVAGGSVPTATATAAPAVRVAPYVDVSLSGEYAVVERAIKTRDLTTINAGFVIASTSNGCAPVWDDNVAVSKDSTVDRLLTAAKQEGATVIPSFGGQSGSELATTCTSRTKLVAAYRSVIKRLGVRRIDFDIEGAAITDMASIQRRFTAIHTLQQDDHQLQVSITVPTLPRGLDKNGVALLRAAAKANVKLSLVNIMTMDYGHADSHMGSDAISAAKHVLVQIRSDYDAKAGLGMVGVTPEIGRNDTASEVFTLADAARLAAFASSDHLGEIAFWSLDRDQQCAHASTRATYNCSGVRQSRFAFTKALQG